MERWKHAQKAAVSVSWAKLQDDLMIPQNKELLIKYVLIAEKIWNQNQLLLAVITSMDACYYTQWKKVQAAWGTAWQSMHSTHLLQNIQKDKTSSYPFSPSLPCSVSSWGLTA